ncbi:MAG TPA: FAD-dependent oxidoreductase [Solirubrobacteraceae bacterium]|nr:FAD-dependent oxidoreductase [Solirubrobacteraceae bacterium]
METHLAPRSPARVLIAGGGFAAVEAALALRALAAGRVRLTLISPKPVLDYRPAATLEPFLDGHPLKYDLHAIAADLGAQFRPGRIEAVAPEQRSVRTDSGAHLDYDALILATGARATSGIPGAPTFRDQRDAHLLRRLLSEIATGAVRRVVFAVPSGCSWPLPMYELALLCSARAHELGAELEVSLVSSEREPLALFGTSASYLVKELLDERGVRFIGAAAATGVRRDGALMLQSDGAVSADRVVSAPELRGRRITGVPARWWGFVPTDAEGRVEGLDGVYAAGDMTTFPVKQAGLAAQQADRIAHTIAAGLGVPVKEFRARHVLRAQLLGGAKPIVLRTELDAWGRPTGATLEHVEAGAPKIFARYLTPYLETLAPVVESRMARGA